MNHTEHIMSEIKRTERWSVCRFVLLRMIVMVGAFVCGGFVAQAVYRAISDTGGFELLELLVSDYALLTEYGPGEVYALLTEVSVQELLVMGTGGVIGMICALQLLYNTRFILRKLRALGRIRVG